MVDAMNIYVVCLASYNAGIGHGRWIDAGQDIEKIHGEVDFMLDESPTDGAEEYAIHDYEGFGPLKIREHESLEKVSRLADAIEEHGEAFAAYLDHIGGLRYLDTGIESFQEAYQGDFKSGALFAEHYTEMVYGDLPDWIRPYINWHRVWDGEFSVDYWIDKGYVFRAI